MHGNVSRPYSINIWTSQHSLCRGQRHLWASAGLLHVAAHPHKAVKIPETGHRFDSLRQINRKHWGLRSMYGVWRQWQKEVRHEEREMEQVWNRVWASGSTLLLSDTLSPHLQLTFLAARFFHNLSHSQELLPTAKNLLPNLIMILQTLVTIALWEHTHTYSLQWLWPQVKLSI